MAGVPSVAYQVDMGAEDGGILADMEVPPLLILMGKLILEVAVVVVEVMALQMQAVEDLGLSSFAIIIVKYALQVSTIM